MSTRTLGFVALCGLLMAGGPVVLNDQRETKLWFGDND